MKQRQRGVALITAMLIVAIVATVATSLALGQQIWLRQTQNLADLARAEKIRMGALEIAAAVLTRDARNARTGATDDLTEDWARAIPPLPVEGGVVMVSIADAQARFNLNNLAHAPASNPGQQGQNLVDYRAIYRALLLATGIDPMKVDALTEALRDWIDPDQNLSPGGAEDLDYLNHDPPYRAANQPLRSVDELRLVKGYTAEIIEKIRPYVIAICHNCTPAGAMPLPINVNTAPAEVLAALLNRSPADAGQIVQAREKSPFKNDNEFKALLGGQAPPAGSYALKSQYFIVKVETRIGRTRRITETLIERSGASQDANVLWYRQPSFPIALDEDKS